MKGDPPLTTPPNVTKRLRDTYTKNRALFVSLKRVFSKLRFPRCKHLRTHEKTITFENRANQFE